VAGGCSGYEFGSRKTSLFNGQLASEPVWLTPAVSLRLPRRRGGEFFSFRFFCFRVLEIASFLVLVVAVMSDNLVQRRDERITRKK